MWQQQRWQIHAETKTITFWLENSGVDAIKLFFIFVYLHLFSFSFSIVSPIMILTVDVPSYEDEIILSRACPAEILYQGALGSIEYNKQRSDLS